MCLREILFYLGKNSSDTFGLLQQAFVDGALSRLTSLSGLKYLRKVGYSLKTMNDLLDPRLKKRMNLWLVFVKLCEKPLIN